MALSHDCLLLEWLQTSSQCVWFRSKQSSLKTRRGNYYYPRAAVVVLESRKAIGPVKCICVIWLSIMTSTKV